LLPCDNAALRADASQRPTFKIGKKDMLPIRVEQALTTLLLRELKMQNKVEGIKRHLEFQYDFNIQSAFKIIDDWSYGYLDQRNLRRFLRTTGVLLSNQELIAMIRRIDLDGDAKVGYEEFFEGVKS
jgi:Ca2+-binding EF-hand superfamily protein